MRMTRTFLIWAAVVTLGLSANVGANAQEPPAPDMSVAPASPVSGATMIAFYSSIEGYWRGRGTETVLHVDGIVRRHPFDLRVDFRDRFGMNWEVKNERRQYGVIYFSSFHYGVRGDLLLIGQFQPTVPVRVLESTPRSLTYQEQRYDPSTGRVYVHTFLLQRSADGRSLLGQNTTELNGVRVREDRFKLEKW